MFNARKQKRTRRQGVGSTGTSGGPTIGTNPPRNGFVRPGFGSSNSNGRPRRVVGNRKPAAKANHPFKVGQKRKQGGYPRLQRYNNKRSTLRPRKSAETISTAKQDKMAQEKYAAKIANTEESYGPPPSISQDFDVGAQTITVVTNAGFGEVFEMAMGVLLPAINSYSTLGPSNPIHGIMYLAQYIYAEWNEIVHTYPLYFAPAVFWDLLDAGRRRMHKGVAYRMVVEAGTGTTAWDVTLDTWSADLGIDNGSLNGYVNVNGSSTGYDETKGHAMASFYFTNCSELLSCVNRNSYRKIWDNEVSLFHDSNSIPGYSSDHGLGIGINRYSAGGAKIQGGRPTANSSLLEPTCEWLHRLRVNVDPSGQYQSQYYNKAWTTTYTGNAAIIADRIIRKLKGKQLHKTYPILKLVSAADFMDVYTDMLVYLAGISGAFAGALHNVTFYEAKFIIKMLLQHHFGAWSSVAAGCEGWSGAAGNWRYLFAGGNAQVAGKPVRSVDMMMTLAINMAHLYPYIEGDRSVYPVLWYDRQPKEAANIWKPTQAPLLEDNDWTTNTTTNGPIFTAIADTGVVEVITGHWVAMHAANGNYMHNSKYLKFESHNFACTTFLTYALYTFGMTGKIQVPRGVQALWDVCVVPKAEMASATADDNYFATVQLHYGEKYKELFPDPDREMYTYVSRAQQGILHDKYGSSTKEDSVDPNNNNVCPAKEANGKLANMAGPLTALAYDTMTRYGLQYGREFVSNALQEVEDMAQGNNYNIPVPLVREINGQRQVLNPRRHRPVGT